MYFVSGSLSSLKITSFSISHCTTLRYSPSKACTNIDYEEDDGDYEDSTMGLFIDDSTVAVVWGTITISIFHVRTMNRKSLK